jgi:type II secretory pathway pseudopilin PulG
VGRRIRTQRRGAFTLIEVLVTIVLVTLAVVGVFGGIRSLTKADIKAREADILQRLAAQKLAEMGTISDPNTAEPDGDFSDEGYPDVTWTMEVEPSGTLNVSQIVLTATRGEETQSLTALVFVRPVTGTTGQ